MSPWANPSAFAVFANGATTSSLGEEEVKTVDRGMTSD